MTGQGRGRRRRGRRGQRAHQDIAPQEQATTPQADEPASSDASPPEAPRAARRDIDAQDAGRQAVDGGRKRTRGKRRGSSRLQTIGPMPSEVLKPAVRNIPATGTIAVRELDTCATREGMTFGCPMLSRTRIGMPFAQGKRVPRCSMGWALHNEDEALLCMRTPDQLDCWKVHPEREAALRANQETENAAD